MDTKHIYLKCLRLTYDEWQERERQVSSGSKAVTHNKKGIALFTYDQTQELNQSDEFYYEMGLSYYAEFWK